MNASMHLRSSELALNPSENPVPMGALDKQALLNHDPGYPDQQAKRHDPDTNRIIARIYMQPNRGQ